MIRDDKCRGRIADCCCFIKYVLNIRVTRNIFNCAIQFVDFYTVGKYWTKPEKLQNKLRFSRSINKPNTNF